MRILFAGTIGRSGLGGQAWASLQYLLGFRALGHEVVYLEDCGQSSWVYNWHKQEWTTDLAYPAAYVRDCLAAFGLTDHWIYRTDEGSVGMPLSEFREFCSSTDLLIIRAVPLWVWRSEYDKPRRRAFIDVDPGFTQISIASGDKGIAAGVARCEKRFTVGQRIQSRRGELHEPYLGPTDGGPWIPTLPPVFLPEWPFASGGNLALGPAPSTASNDLTIGTHFTSIMRWQGFREAQHQGNSYGQRDKEFPKFFDLPRLTSQKFCIAHMGVDPAELQKHGWEVAPGEVVSQTPSTYRSFIQQSRAEFSVPKHGYVKMRGGWVSDRSVCYLASGRPVLIEDTGIGSCLPIGEGLLTFRNLDEAVAGVEAINRNYDRHRRAARELVEQILATDKVLPPFLDEATGDR
jgi:hypothetical protein